ncbi:outer membrane beta-barrel protein [Chryseobacterium sp. JM1]|uniref:outer membrane beta-barrel protein n=1 Tax=Chryseobacterium sp. JM1 TaxID=1233950 RepID=UPI0004E6CD95|nr:outer membrane beta-barrel protein [Chryseobacterium sp. JM1]KFF22360.1 hypothetical protein IW22_04035 [Chryseobacterium sp. JM1]
MNNQWLNDLHRKMEDHKEDIPDGLWEDIKDELFSEEEENGIAGAMMFGADDEKENINPSVENKRSLWYRVGGVAAAIAMLFFTGKLLLDMNAEKTGPKITKKAENVDESPQIEKRIMDPVLADTNDKAKTNEVEKYSHAENILNGKTSTEQILKNILGHGTNYNKVISGSQEKEKGVELFKKETQPANISPLANENPVVKEKKEVEEIFNTPENELHEKMAATDKSKIRGRQSKKWMLNMLTGSVSSNSSDQKFPGYASISGSPMAFSDIFMSGTEADPLTEVLLANQSKEVEARIRHKIPVTFGLSMYYNIGKRWGIGTGVNYTKLTSELHSGSNSNYIKGEQSIHYIGIPVQVNYNVIQKGRFTGYVTGGVLAEKAVAGKLRTKYIVNDEVTDSQDERLDVKPVQFSVNSAVGLQVKIIDKIGIYAEPGIGYHFKNDSQLNTIYKEKPLNFNMKFGIRLLLD